MRSRLVGPSLVSTSVFNPVAMYSSEELPDGSVIPNTCHCRRSSGRAKASRLSAEGQVPFSVLFMFQFHRTRPECT